MSTQLPYGNVRAMGMVGVVFDPASVAANTTAAQTVTVKGVLPGDMVTVNKPTTTAGLGLAGARVSAADTVSITFSNSTASPIDAASETYVFLIFRPDGALPSLFTT